MAATLVFGGLTLTYPVGGWDIPTYSYIASVIRDGGIPYRDAWDLKGPGIFFVHALGQALFGTSAVSIRLFDLLWQFATALLLAAVTFRVARRHAVSVLAGVLYLLTYFARNGWDWAQPDSFVTLPLAAAVLAALAGAERDRWLWWVLAGASIGLAVLLKSPFGLLGLALLWLATVAPAPGTGVIARRWIGLAAGLVAPLAVCAAYFAAHGALGDLWTAQFVLAPEYTQRIHSYRSITCLFRSALQPVNAPLHGMGLLALGTVAAAWRQQRENLRALLLLLMWAGTVLVVMILHGKYDSMHFVSFLAPLGCLSAVGLDQLWSAWRMRRSRPALAVLVLAALVLVVPAKKLADHARATVRNLRGEVSTEANPPRELALYLSERTAPDERIFVWSGSPAVYYYSGRRSCSRFIHVYFLIIRWKSVDLRPVLLEEFRANPPKYFALLKAQPAQEGAAPLVEFRCEPETVQAEAGYYEFAELRAAVAAGYEVELDTPHYIVYRRRDTP